jgi:hypothetical protein
MPGRIRPLSLMVRLSALAALILAASSAHAHRLDAQVFLLPNRKVQVESWFSNGEAAKGAKVQVFSAREKLITEGQLNEQGVFIFPCGDIDPRTVVISAGAGHRKVLSLSASFPVGDVAGTAQDQDWAARPNGVSSAPVPLAGRDPGSPVKDVLVGVGFLLALAAFVLSVRNARKLRALARLDN